MVFGFLMVFRSVGDGVKVIEMSWYGDKCVEILFGVDFYSCCLRLVLS